MSWRLVELKGILAVPDPLMLLTEQEVQEVLEVMKEDPDYWEIGDHKFGAAYCLYYISI